MSEVITLNETNSGKRHSTLQVNCPHQFVVGDFGTLLPTLSIQQREDLEASLLAEDRCLSPLIVWQETNMLVDGHHRWPIIQRHPHIQYEIVEISFASRAEAVKWIFKHHDCHRMWRSRFEQIEHYIRNFGEEFREACKIRMERGTSDPSASSLLN